jgi:hypothetical protein
MSTGILVVVLEWQNHYVRIAAHSVDLPLTVLILSFTLTTSHNHLNIANLCNVPKLSKTDKYSMAVAFLHILKPRITVALTSRPPSLKSLSALARN